MTSASKGPARAVDTNVQLDDLDVFVRVIEGRSMSAAARVLGVPKSTVSRAISRLEDGLRVRLIQRTSRVLAPTDAGHSLYEETRPHVIALRAASNVVSESVEVPSGTLRITAPNEIGTYFLADALSRFRKLYPLLHFDVVLTTRTVDIVSEGFDLAIRAGVLRDSTLVARKVSDIDMFVCAAPSYLKAHPAPTTLEDLSTHEAVLFRASRGQATWTLEKGDVTTNIEVRGAVSSDEFGFVTESIRAGLGIGIVPAFLVRGDIAKGALVHLLPDHVARLGSLYLVHASGKHLPRKVVVLRDFLIEAFRAL